MLLVTSAYLLSYSGEPWIFRGSSNIEGLLYHPALHFKVSASLHWWDRERQEGKNWNNQVNHSCLWAPLYFSPIVPVPHASSREMSLCPSSSCCPLCQAGRVSCFFSGFLAWSLISLTLLKCSKCTFQLTPAAKGCENRWCLRSEMELSAIEVQDYMRNFPRCSLPKKKRIYIQQQCDMC